MKNNMNKGLKVVGLAAATFTLPSCGSGTNEIESKTWLNGLNAINSLIIEVSNNSESGSKTQQVQATYSKTGSFTLEDDGVKESFSYGINGTETKKDNNYYINNSDSTIKSSNNDEQAKLITSAFNACKESYWNIAAENDSNVFNKFTPMKDYFLNYQINKNFNPNLLKSNIGDDVKTSFVKETVKDVSKESFITKEFEESIKYSTIDFKNLSDTIFANSNRKDKFVYKTETKSYRAEEIKVTSAVKDEAGSSIADTFTGVELFFNDDKKLSKLVIEKEEQTKTKGDEKNTIANFDNLEINFTYETEVNMPASNKTVKAVDAIEKGVTEGYIKRAQN